MNKDSRLRRMMRVLNFIADSSQLPDENHLHLCAILDLEVRDYKDYDPTAILKIKGRNKIFRDMVKARLVNSDVGGD